MINVVLIVHVLASVGLIVLVLLQHGKGADMGAAFGSGGSQTLFGARGAANFLSRVTAVLAAVFFLTSLSLAYLYSQVGGPKSVTEQITPAQAPPAEVEKKSATPQAPPKPGVPEVPE